MTIENGEAASEQVEELVRWCHELRDDVDYVAVTLHVDDDDWIVEVLSAFAGYPDDDAPAKGVERRSARFANLGDMPGFWKEADQGWIVVHNTQQLGVFSHMRGNALMARDFTLQHFPFWVEPESFAHLGALGFTPYDPDSREATKRRPLRRQRQRVLERDGHRCQKPGCETPEDEQVDLQLHHIRPVKDGGLTVDDNLITLCSTCHDNLEPHFNQELLWLSDSPARRAQKAVEDATHRGGIEGHRRRLIALLDGLDDDAQQRLIASFEH